MPALAPEDSLLLTVPCSVYTSLRPRRNLTLQLAVKVYGPHVLRHICTCHRVSCFPKVLSAMTLKILLKGTYEHVVYSFMYKV